MTICTTRAIEFSRCKGRKVEGKFNGGDITSDGGVLLLREADRKLGLTERIINRLVDSRRKKSCRHSLGDMLRQRVYAIAQGYEDLNDHDTLRNDAVFQSAVNRDAALASPSTLCRFENRADQSMLWNMSTALVEVFIESFDRAPEELILDFDSTDDAVHGEQVGRFFHGYYDHYCFLPLYVFCGNHLLAAYLRPSNIDNAKNAWAILALLVKRFRQVWPQVRIIFRGDSGFCRHRMFDWCEKNGVFYLVGIAQNSRLLEQSHSLICGAERLCQATGEKQRIFGKVAYAAETWNRKRRVIVKAEHSARGPNPRFVVTNLSGDPKTIYDQVYCARGEAENRIKEQQLCLFADRTSCMNWLPNQFRVLLSALAYALVESMRRIALRGSELARARCDTIRLKLLKIGAVIIRNTRRVKLLYSSAYPYQGLFIEAAYRLRC